MEANATKQKFALQLYSRLTNANPELVLVFMQAGTGGIKQVRSWHEQSLACVIDYKYADAILLSGLYSSLVFYKLFCSSSEQKLIFPAFDFSG